MTDTVTFAPMGAWWDGPVTDSKELDDQPDGTIAIDDVGVTRQRCRSHTVGYGWTEQGRIPLTSGELIKGGRPVWLLRTSLLQDQPPSGPASGR